MRPKQIHCEPPTPHDEYFRSPAVRAKSRRKLSWPPSYKRSAGERGIPANLPWTPASRFKMRTSLVPLLLAAGAAHAKYIVPGGRWHDTDGNLINAHAGGVTVDPETGKFFWFGEYKIEGQEEGGGVTVYSSEDLATWTYEGLALGRFVRSIPLRPRADRPQNPSRATPTFQPSISSRGRRWHTARARTSIT